MLAAVFEGDGQLVLTDRPKPSIKRPDDVLIKVTGVGICGTDLHILQVPPAHPARLGCILGHEFTGEVAETGEAVTAFRPGDRVIVDPHPPCGRCGECKRGRPDHCEALYAHAEPGHPNTVGIFSDGAMASYVVVPERSLYRVAQHVPAHIAALAEPLSCVVSAANKVGVQPGDTTVILGAGPIGLLFTCVFRASGASKVIVSEISATRREVARACGATTVVDPRAEDLNAVVARETTGGADVVVEAVGPLLNDCILLARTGGRVIQFGHDELARPSIQVGEVVRKEITIHGAFIGRFSFERVARILESGSLPLDKVVSHRLPLRKVHDGLGLLRRGQALKVILHPEEW